MSDPLFPFRKEAEIHFRSCENPRTSVTASRGVECLITANPYKNTFVRVLRIGELSKEEAEVVEERFGQIADTFLDDVSRS